MMPTLPALPALVSVLALATYQATALLVGRARRGVLGSSRYARTLREAALQRRRGPAGVDQR